jgi:hypothetical protein
VFVDHIGRALRAHVAGATARLSPRAGARAEASRPGKRSPLHGRHFLEKGLAFGSKVSMCVHARAALRARGRPSPGDRSDPGLASVTGPDWLALFETQRVEHVH